jgi:hypothetical protein
VMAERPELRIDVPAYVGAIDLPHGEASAALKALDVRRGPAGAGDRTACGRGWRAVR